MSRRIFLGGGFCIFWTFSILMQLKQPSLYFFRKWMIVDLDLVGQKHFLATENGFPEYGVEPNILAFLELSGCWSFDAWFELDESLFDISSTNLLFLTNFAMEKSMLHLRRNMILSVETNQYYHHSLKNFGLSAFWSKVQNHWCLKFHSISSSHVFGFWLRPWWKERNM